MTNQTKKLYEIPELLAQNGGPIPMSKSGLYAAIAKANIPCVVIGRRKFVPSWYIDILLMPPTETKGA